MEEFDSSVTDDSIIDVSAQPSKYPFLSKLGLDQDVCSRLSLHLDRLVQGDNSVYTSALCKDNSPSVILDGWDKIFKSKEGQLNGELLSIELDNREKFGPRSISKPWNIRRDSLKQYYKDQGFQLSYNPADALSFIKSQNLRPLSVNKAIGYLKNASNSGLPYYTKKRKVKERVGLKYEYLLDRRDPCILFTRTQEGDKTRNVWGYPIADTIEEMRFYRPLLDYQSRLPWRSALNSPHAVDLAISKLMAIGLANDYVFISGDVPAFDTNAVRQMTDASFLYVKKLFQGDCRYALDRIRDRFQTIGVVTPDGITQGYHGVPSGSTFTNEIDSIIQYIVVKSLGFIRDDMFQVQGDDIVLCIPEDKIETLFSRYKESHLGLSDVKTKVSKECCVYLQRLYHKDFVQNGFIGGIYSTYRALGRICFQERWSTFEDYDISGKDYYSIRTISILENCKYHPLFEDIVRYVYSLDKYQLRFSKSGVNKYHQFIEESSSSGGFLNNQYGNDIKGIGSFETVKILRKLWKA